MGEQQTSVEKKIKDMNFDELKDLLKRMEQTEDYEICRMIQDEIDTRVNDRT